MLCPVGGYNSSTEHVRGKVLEHIGLLGVHMRTPSAQQTCPVTHWTYALDWSSRDVAAKIGDGDKASDLFGVHRK